MSSVRCGLCILQGGAMRSKASYKGHPIHPAMTVFTAAALWPAG
jgi:hypothetical protein